MQPRGYIAHYTDTQVFCKGVLIWIAEDIPSETLMQSYNGHGLIVRLYQPNMDIIALHTPNKGAVEEVNNMLKNYKPSRPTAVYGDLDHYENCINLPIKWNKTEEFTFIRGRYTSRPDVIGFLWMEGQIERGERYSDHFAIIAKIITDKRWRKLEIFPYSRKKAMEELFKDIYRPEWPAENITNLAKICAKGYNRSYNPYYKYVGNPDWAKLYRQNYMDIIQKAYYDNDNKTIWKLTHNYCHPKSKALAKYIRIKDQVIPVMQATAHIKEFYEKIYFKPDQIIQAPEDYQILIGEEDCICKKKAFGLDYMPDDIFKRTKKIDGDFIHKNAVKIILEKLNNIKNIPDWWKRGRLILISKKGKEIAELDDTRPIIINTTLYKNIERSIGDIRAQLWPQMFKGQNGFRPGASTQDNITLVRGWMRTRIRLKRPSVIFSIDIKKSF